MEPSPEMPPTTGHLEAARALTPRIQAGAAQAELERQLPADLVRAMNDAGLFHMFVTGAAGGAQHDPLTVARVIEEVSFADAAAGWCVMIANQNGSFSGYFEEKDAIDIWGNGGITCGTANPIGRAVAEARGGVEGFKVTGSWGFASGSSHATQFVAESTIYDGDVPRRDAAGNLITRILVFPRDAVTIHDTWDTTGLRATASNDFSIDGAWCAASRGMQMLVSQPLQPWPLYGALWLMFTTHGAQGLGVGRAAIASAAEIAASKIAWGSHRPLNEQPRMQLAAAEATALVGSARAFLYETITNAWDGLLATGSADAATRARVRLATSHAVRASARAVDLVHDAVGTASIFRKNPIERQYRDIHTAAAHVMVSPLTMEAAGRVELGLEAQFPFF
jgi:alkylation response protein AidB-like acyl-CoA dehydrogenase